MIKGRINFYLLGTIDTTDPARVMVKYVVLMQLE
jgi:hypothetical protein